MHGAWHGGWCWRRVAERLRKTGHRVFTPTLTGLGERAHLLTPALDAMKQRHRAGWEFIALTTGHDLMVSAPEETAQILLRHA